MGITRLGLTDPEPPREYYDYPEDARQRDEAFAEKLAERLKQGRFIMTEEERELYRSHLKTGVPEPRD